MNSTVHHIFNFLDQELWLLPGKAMFWNDQQTLLIADAHIGKATHFRKEGLPVPAQVMTNNFRRLDEMIAYTSPEKVVFLGDLFHSSRNRAWTVFRDWMAGFPEIRFVLVKGNHDILQDADYVHPNLECIEGAWESGPFLWTHEPLDEVPDGYYNLCGHIHPAVRMHGAGRQSLKLPCFFFSERVGILPAFGTFTGTAVLQPDSKDKIFVVTGDKVIPVSG